MYCIYFNCPFNPRRFQNYLMRNPSLLRYSSSSDSSSMPNLNTGEVEETSVPGAPTTPPPDFKPSKHDAISMDGTTEYIDFFPPPKIDSCVNRFLYLWLKNGKELWVWSKYVDHQYIGGFYWTRSKWEYFGIDLGKIDKYYCYYSK